MYTDLLKASIIRKNKNMIEYAMKKLRHLEHVATLEELEPIFTTCERTHDIDMIARVASILNKAHVYPSRRIVLSLFNSCVHKDDFVSGADLFKKWKEHKRKLDVESLDDIVRLLATGGDLAGTVDALISKRSDAETGLSRQAYEALVDCFLRFGGEIESLPQSLRGRGSPTSSMHIMLRNFLVTAHHRKKAERPGVFKAFLKESIRTGSYDGVTLSFRFQAVSDLALLGSHFPTWQRKKIGGLQETFASAMKVALDARKVEKAELVLSGTKAVRGLSPQVYHQVIRMRIMQGQPEAAARILSEMESKGLHPLAQSVALLVESSDGDEAAALLEKSRKIGIAFDQELYVKVLETHGLSGEEVQRVFSHMVRAKIFPSLRAFCALYASFSLDNGEREAHKFLKQLSNAENICDLRSAYELLQLGEYAEKEQIVNWINEALRSPDPFGVKEMVKTFHDRLPKGKVDHVEFELQLKDGELDDARQSLRSIEKPKVGMYVRLLHEYTKRKQVDRAISLYSEMGKRDIAKSLNVYKTLMGSLMLFQKFEDAMEIAEDFLSIESHTPDPAFLRMCEIALKVAGSPTNYDIVSRVKERMGVDLG
ncbi:hypothetical protein NDN08_005237 [Rhodosorus marinus]|nr:hypothetical protein NDN08_005237 [Rhodosorus marinus]